MDIKTICSKDTYHEFLSESKNKKLILFGACENAMYVMSRFLPGIPVDYIVDNDVTKQNKEFISKRGIHSHIAVKSPEHLQNENPNRTVILIASLSILEIFQQLEDMGIDSCYTVIENEHYEWFVGRKDSSFLYSQDKVNQVLSVLADEKSKHVFSKLVEARQNRSSFINASEIYEPTEYFLESIFDHYIDENNVYLDLGCFDSETISEYILFARNSYKKIIGFEAEKNNYKKIADYFASNPKIELYPYAVYNKNEDIRFVNNFGAGSSVNDAGSDFVKAVKLDDFISDKVTFIKMDIEGSEPQAIDGAQHIIRTDKPNLAICIYHTPEQLVSIPLQIHSLVPEYKLYVRHHSLNYSDTVLYATL